MKLKRNFYLIVYIFSGLQIAYSQDVTPYKFGKITAADFNLPPLSFDSGANAVIISDIGVADFQGNEQGNFDIVFTRYMRVKIINKNGFDIGSRSILLYHNTKGVSETLFELKGSTFNLENGIVKETKLDDKSVFTEKYNKFYNAKKFAMPALKEGAIFDILYTTKSPFLFDLNSWSFQGEYPRLWSEYVVTIPAALHYVLRTQGDQHFDIDTKTEVHKSYVIKEHNGVSSDDTYNVHGMALNKRWAKKNVPALRGEAFTTNVGNYESKVSFQLQYVQWTAESDKSEVMADWNGAAKELLDRDDFGHPLTDVNGWMSDILKNLISGANSDDEKARKIYAFVRDNFREGSNGESRYINKSLKDVFNSKEGNVAEINLLLIAMMRKADIKADPVILSTRGNGFSEASYPLIEEYNYVICIAYPGNHTVILDASDRFNGYDELPGRCYNGWAHIISDGKPSGIFLSADSLWESSVTSVNIVSDDKGVLGGSYSGLLGKSESNEVRNEIGRTSFKLFGDKVQKENISDLTIENLSIDSLKQYDFPVTIKYEFGVKNISGDIVYFNPIIGGTYKNNPFKSAERLYPVEIPYKIDETYILNMEIPAGYAVDELPKSSRVAYNVNEGMFEYLIQKGDNNIQMRVKLKLNKAFFPTEEYGNLRDFFAYVVKKESEQIVFKKIK